MTNLLRNSVRLEQREIGIDLDVHRDMQGMTYPAARTSVTPSTPAIELASVMIEGYQTVIDSVEQTLQNAARCRVDDGEDHNSNDDARDRIGKGETQPDSHQTHKRRQRGQKPSIRECCHRRSVVRC